jgi:hypothetical protein
MSGVLCTYAIISLFLSRVGGHANIFGLSKLASAAAAAAAAAAADVQIPPPSSSTRELATLEDRI